MRPKRKNPSAPQSLTAAVEEEAVVVVEVEGIPEVP